MRALFFVFVHEYGVTCQLGITQANNGRGSGKAWECSWHSLEEQG